MQQSRQQRLIVDLGRYPVVDVKRDALNVSFTLVLPNGTKLVAFNLPARADVTTQMRLSLYTEVLLHDVQ